MEKFVDDGALVMLDPTFPNDKNAPARADQLFLAGMVSLDRSTEFGLPKLGLTGRDSRIATVRVPMPETTVGEYNGAKAGKNEVRPARQAEAMEPET